MFGDLFWCSGWAVLAAGALVASLLAVGATPVGAEEENADHEAGTSACVGDALGDQMYTDVSDDHAFADAINCIGYYGITNGTGDGSTFSGNDDVTRAEMAVFLARAAGVAGVDLGDATDAGFDDIDDIWEEAQDAINQLTDKGILPEGDSYRPHDAMKRSEMALALVGFLNEASSNVNINDNGDIELGADEEAADDYFADARAESPAAVDDASAALFELGVTNGTGRAAVVDDSETPLDTNFDPSGTVNRGQMAAFITRALAHTSARPEGVTAQAVGNKVLVSVRDENYAPVTNAWVDVFYVDTADEDAALDSDGECGRLVERSGHIDDANMAVRDGMFACEIDGADLITNGNGDAETQALDVPDDGVVAWAWTGDVGDEVDDDTALFRLAMGKAPADAETSTQAFISTDLSGTRAKMGSSITVTLQLQNADGDDVSGGAQEADEPAKWLASISTFLGPAVGQAGQASQVLTVPFKSDSDGKGTFVVASLPDPRPDDSGDSWTVQYVVTADPRGCATVADDATAWDSCSAPVADSGGTPPAVAPAATITDGDGDTNSGAQDSTGSVTFSDLSGVAQKIEIDTSSYVVVAGRAGRSALNRATVTVTDQFGDPVNNVKVTLTSSQGQGDADDNENSSLADSPANANAGAATADDATDDANNGRQFTTGSDGTYTFGYTWSSTDGAVETLTARTAAITAANGDALTEDDADADNVATEMVNWAEEAGDTSTGTPAVADGDVDANQIVVVVAVDGTDTPMVLTYDDDDRFNISPADSTDSGPASMAAFEKMLAGALEPGAGTVNVTWSNYSSRPRNTSVFTLDDPSTS